MTQPTHMILNNRITIDDYPSLSIHTPEYTIYVTDKHIQVACAVHTFDEWWSYSDREISLIDGRKGLAWWRKWKPVLQEIVKQQR